MGYEMQQVGGQFRISEPDKWLALAALHELARQPLDIRWVDKRAVAAAGTLGLALALCGWQALVDVADNIIGLQLECLKAGDEDRLFTAIAPFVEPGSYIEMTGEAVELPDVRVTDG